ncbi:MAG TPA: hypothetical protein VMK53_05275 [Gemmatimonadales bacterium]|nr:hypothetical protein [Gemmatimonadales bacterium]
MTGLEDLTQVVTTVTGVLETHRVPYFITGSLASSAHAEFRATNDLDIVADFTTANLRDLMQAFDAEFYADAEQAAACVQQGHSFNLIHRRSYLKVDFFPAVSAFNRKAIERAEVVVLGAGGPALRVATREDILLAKLQWYRLGDESSEQQRRDIVGIVSLNRDRLDRAYLGRWARELKVEDLLDRFLGRHPEQG